MGNLLPGILTILVFVLILSVWNWMTANLPGSVGGSLNWIVFLIALIIAIVVFLQTSRER